ncbi:MAG: hypothetical protein U0905_07565 [Pirellulales bacterium]
MATVAAPDFSARQLCFDWNDTCELGASSQGGVVVAPRRSRPQSRPVQTNSRKPVSVPSTARVEEKTRRSTDRVGGTQHISGLMVAVLARYGIDAESFLAEMEQNG